MPDTNGMFAVGEHHIDSNGIERISNAWGFNSFATADGAEQTLRSRARRSTPTRESRWWIRRLPDGTYDYSALPEPLIPPADRELARVVVL